MALVPQQNTNTGPSTGIKAKAPGGIISSNPNTIKSTFTAPTSQQNAVSPGSYHGTQINPGTDAEVAAQIAKINGGQMPVSSQQQSVGTQHPGDAGFIHSSSLPKNPSNSNLGQGQTTVYGPNGTSQLVQNGTGNTNQGSMGSLIASANIPQQPQNGFSGYVNQLGNQQASPYNNIAQAGILGAQGASQATYGQGYNLAQQSGGQALDAVQKLRQLQDNLATGQGQIYQEAIPLQFQQGRAQALQNMYGGQQAALSQEIAGLQGLYGAGAGQQAIGIGGLNSSAGQAISGQGTAQNALQSAAQLSQPQLGSIGQVPFNPLDQSQGQVLGSTQPGGLQGAGQLLGQFQGAQAVGAAPGQTQASNYQTLGTANAQGQAAGIQAQAAAPGTTAANIYGQQQGIAAGYQSALQQGQNLQTQLSDLITSFGLNPSDINAANAGIQKIAENTSSPQYKVLQNYINDVANTYAQVLTPPGGSATDTTRGIAASMLDATASGKSILAVMQSLDQAAKAKIAGVSTSQGSIGGNSQIQVKAGDGNNYGFYQDANGVWHAG